MAYGRRLKRFRRRFRRRYGRSSFRRKVRRIVYNIAEKKYFEYGFDAGGKVQGNNMQSIGAAAVDLAATWTPMSLVACMQQGNGNNQRIGNKISVKYVQLSLVFLMSNATATTAPTAMSASLGAFCRYMVLLDKGPGLVKPSSRNYMTTQGNFTYTPTAGTALNIKADVFGFKDSNFLRRVKTLLDMQHKEINMTAISAANAYPNSRTGIKVVQHYIPVNQTFTYESVGSNTDMDVAGAVMVDRDLVFQVAPSDAACCRLIGCVRVCYTDM